MESVLGRHLAGRDQFVGPAVELGVPERAFDGLLVMGEDPLDPFVIEQSRTVNKLVQHPRGQIIGRCLGERHGNPLRFGRNDDDVDRSASTLIPASDDDARRVDRRIRLTERRDHAIAASLGRPQVDEEHLIVAVVD